MSSTTNVSYGIANSEDDCQTYDSYFGYTYPNFKIGNYSSTSYKAGFRFTGVNIPANATITVSYILFYPYNTLSTSNCKIIVKGEENRNASSFSTLADYNARPRTTVSYTATLGIWSAGNTSRIPEGSDNMNSVINEIRDYTGGTNYIALSNANIVFFIEDNGSALGSYRDAFTFDNGFSYPVLYISYTTPVDYTKTTSTLLGLKSGIIKRIIKLSKKISTKIAFISDKILGRFEIFSTSLKILTIDKIWGISKKFFSSIDEIVSVIRKDQAIFTSTIIGLISSNISVIKVSNRVFSTVIKSIVNRLGVRPSFPWGFEEYFTIFIELFNSKIKTISYTRFNSIILKLQHKISKYFEKIFSSAYVKLAIRVFDKEIGKYISNTIELVSSITKYRGRQFFLSIGLKASKWKKDLTIFILISQAFTVIKNAGSYTRKVKKKMIKILGR